MSEKLVSRSYLWILHSSITIAILSLCSLYLMVFDALTDISNLCKSPVIPMLIASELIKWFVNAKYLNLVGRPKHIPSTHRRDTQFINRCKSFCSGIITLVAFFGIYAFACIIFGAAIIEHLSGTMSLSIVLVTCTALPLVLYLGSKSTWECLCCEQFELTTKAQTAYLEYVQTNAIVCLFGAWISSVVAPLDWDRDWQNYPIPNVCGAILGVSLSNAFWMVMGCGCSFLRKGEGFKSQKTN